MDIYFQQDTQNLFKEQMFLLLDEADPQKRHKTANTFTFSLPSHDKPASHNFHLHIKT